MTWMMSNEDGGDDDGYDGGGKQATPAGWFVETVFTGMTNVINL